jgi:hypothetical protein
VKRIVSLAAGVAVGYVLGSRAGREKYEQIGSPATEGLNTDGDAPVRSRRTSAPRERFVPEATPAAAPAAAETEREELRVTAKEIIEDMPGETALGNADPAAGGHGDPKEYEGK